MPARTLNNVRRLTATIIARGGSEPTEADLVAGHLVDANLAGHDSHGVSLIPHYVRHDEAFLEVPYVVRDQAYPVAVVAGEVGVDEMTGDQVGLGGLAAAAGDDGGGQPAKTVGDTRIGISWRGMDTSAAYPSTPRESSAPAAPLPAQLLAGVAGLLELLHHERHAGGAEGLGAVTEHHDVMAPQREVLVAVRPLHPGGTLAQEPALELSAGDHARLR